MKHALRIAGCLVALALPATAQSLDPAAKAEELKALQREATETSKQVEALEAQIAADVAEQEQLSQKLVAAADAMRGAETRIQLAVEKQAVLQKDKAELGLSLASQQDDLSTILAGLQSLERDPPPALVVAPGDVLDALRGAMLFGTVVPELRDKAFELRGKLESLERIDRQLAEEASAERAALNTLKTARVDLNTALAAKKQSLKQSKASLQVAETQSREIAVKAQSTRELIMRLLAERERASTAVRLKEAERLAAAKAEDERLRKLSALPMSGALGKLRPPVAGRVILGFGTDSGLGHPLDGEVIAGSPGAVITTPVRGRIEFAGAFRSYGNMVIVNAGDGHLLLLAGFGDMAVEQGQDVLAGEPLGSLADPASQAPMAAALAKDLTTDGQPVLYVEFRKNGNPVDPAPWWDRQRQEALR